MTRPDASCLCVDAGIWSAISCDGPSRTRMLDAFLDAHTEPGHVLEQPPRDRFGQEAKLVARLREMAAKAPERPRDARRPADRIRPSSGAKGI